MLSPLRNRFGIPGVISVIALVFAMLGGAYAATNSGSGKATASAKAKKGPRGPKGATGPAGPAGPAGPTGPAGAKGDAGSNGSNGKDGANGTNGTNGTGVTTASFSGSKGACNEEQGGIEVKSASPAVLVCNGVEGEAGEQGEKGDKGDEGEPWSPNNTLPPGATETGAWAFTGTEADTAGIQVPISFPIQLAAGLKGITPGSPEFPTHVHFETEAGFEAACPGLAGAPEANPGELCVYINLQEGVEGTSFKSIEKLTTLLGASGASRSGARLVFAPPTKAVASGNGTFAVTGCSEELPAGDPNKCPE
jgi:hypothetical protein